MNEHGHDAGLERLLAALAYYEARCAGTDLLEQSWVVNHAEALADEARTAAAHAIARGHDGFEIDALAESTRSLIERIPLPDADPRWWARPR